MFSGPERTALIDAARPLARLAFAALIVLSPFRARVELVARPSPPVYGDYTNVLLFWSDLALLLTLGLWATSLATRPRSLSFGPLFLAIPAAGLLAIVVIGIPFATDPGLTAYNALRLFALAGLALYVINEIGTLQQLRGPIAVMVVVQATVAVGQVVGQHSLGLQGIGEHDLLPSLGVSVVTSVDGVRLVRGYGLADHPNILGGVLAFAMLVLVGLRRSAREPIRSVDLFAVGAVALLLTFSRAAIVALVAGLIVLAAMLLLRRERSAVRQVAVAGAVALVACLPFGLAYSPFLAARTDASGVIATEVRSIEEREALAVAATRIFLAHPGLGVGLGGLPVAMLAAEPDFPFTYQPAHIAVLDALAETGVLGGACYLAMLVLPGLALLRHRDRWTVELSAASAALAAVFVVGFFDYYTWTYPAGRIWAWVLLALWAVAYRRALAMPRALSEHDLGPLREPVSA